MPAADAGAGRLANYRVHIGGCGRVGTSVVLARHAAGNCNDPQVFEEEQLGANVFSRRSDLGRPKVDVLARLLDGREGLVFEPLAAPNESAKVMPLLEKADIIVSAANQLPARLRLERAAIALQKPVVSMAAKNGAILAGKREPVYGLRSGLQRG